METFLHSVAKHLQGKRKSRYAARTAKALRWRIKQLLKIIYKEKNSLVHCVLILKRHNVSSYNMVLYV